MVDGRREKEKGSPSSQIWLPIRSERKWYRRLLMALQPNTHKVYCSDVAIGSLLSLDQLIDTLIWINFHLTILRHY